MKLTIICETFNISRYEPHLLITNKINFIKLNEIKISSPHFLIVVFIKLIRAVFDSSYVIIAALPLSPLVFYYLILKFFKKNKVVFETSYVYWKEDKYPLEFGFLKPILKRYWRFFIKDLKIRTINMPAYNFLKKYTSKVRLIPHSVNINFFKPDNKIKKNKKFTILFVGRLEYKKGVDLILEAAEKLSEYDFWLVGKGDYEQKIKEASLKNIKLLGFIGDERELNKIYNKCHCLVLPSRKYKGWEELFGIVIIEAMATGLPVIASNCVGPKEIIQDKNNGLLINQESVSRLVEAIKLLQSDSRLYDKLSRLGYETATKKYNIDAIAKKIEKLLTSIQ